MSYRHTEYTYDSKGRIVSCYIYTTQGAAEPTYSYIYTYDSNDRLGSFTVVDPTGTTVITYTYNSAGEITDIVKTKQEVTL